MKCKYCFKNRCIKKGVRNSTQRYQCKNCSKYQLKDYKYKLFEINDEKNIISLNAEGVGIRSISRVLGYSKGTISRKILELSKRVVRPIYAQYNQTYEVDEMCTFIGSNIPKNYVYITYALNRKTKEVIDVVIGRRTKANLKIIINKLKVLNPKKIVTDKLITYVDLIKPYTHDTNKSRNNRIERANLTLRQQIKRLNRKTLSYSKSLKMLEATLLLYFYWNNWQMKNY